MIISGLQVTTQVGVALRIMYVNSKQTTILHADLNGTPRERRKVCPKNISNLAECQIRGT